MPATTTPTSYLPGLKLVSSDGSGAASAASFANSKQYLCLLMDDIPELDPAEADPTSGDMRKIVFALEAAIYAAYQAIAAADRPAKWVSQRSSAINDADDVISRNFVNQFTTETTGEEVADE